MSSRIYNVLFLCTGNSARSILAEGILRDGPELQKEAAFVAAFRFLKNRITVFTSLPLAGIDKIALGTKLREIGKMDGSTNTRSQAS